MQYITIKIPIPVRKKLRFRIQSWWYQLPPIAAPVRVNELKSNIIVDLSGNEVTYLFTSKLHKEIHLRIRQHGSDNHVYYSTEPKRNERTKEMESPWVDELRQLVFITDDVRYSIKWLIGLFKWPKLPNFYLVNCTVRDERQHAFYDEWGKKAIVSKTDWGTFLFNSPNLKDVEVGLSGDDAKRRPTAFGKQSIKWYRNEIKKQ